MVKNKKKALIIGTISGAVAIATLIGGIKISKRNPKVARRIKKKTFRLKKGAK